VARSLTVFGHAGCQVREVIHAADLARKKSISLLEAFDLIEKVTGKKMNYELGPEREADHIWWISNVSKARHHYPDWSISIGLEEIFKDISETLSRA
jgi:CDP-paratose 2-epimerase